MNNWAYNVVVNGGSFERETRVNNINMALAVFDEAYREGESVAVINGFTGEVLAHLNVEDEFQSEEFALMYSGWRLMNLYEKFNS